ncbi:hypothetical protein BsWGS_12045 [Bradybaena similaris]
MVSYMSMVLLLAGAVLLQPQRHPLRFNVRLYSVTLVSFVARSLLARIVLLKTNVFRLQKLSQALIPRVDVPTFPMPSSAGRTQATARLTAPRLTLIVPQDQPVPGLPRYWEFAADKILLSIKFRSELTDLVSALRTSPYVEALRVTTTLVAPEHKNVVLPVEAMYAPTLTFSVATPSVTPVKCA